MARPLLRRSLGERFFPARRVRGSTERGATVSEYALIVSLVLTVAVGVITLLEDSSGSYLIETGSDIGAPRGLAADFGLADPATPPWLIQPPSPPVPTYGPNLLTNAGFETPSAGGSFVIAAAPPWTSTDSGVEIWNDGHAGVPAYEGLQFAELNVSDITTYSQTVTVETGKTYQWSFAHRGYQDTDTLEILLNGTAVASIATAPGAWVTHQDTFVASGTTVILALRSVDTGGSGNLIDDVVLREYENP